MVDVGHGFAVLVVAGDVEGLFGENLAGGRVGDGDDAVDDFQLHDPSGVLLADVDGAPSSRDAFLRDAAARIDSVPSGGDGDIDAGGFEPAGLGGVESGRVHAAVVGERGRGIPYAAHAARNDDSTVFMVTVAYACEYRRNLGWSSSQETISASVPSAIGQRVKSDCHVSFGNAASNLMYEDFGRFLGSGLTSPASLRIRWIVEFVGGLTPSRSNRAAMDSGPASRPLEPRSRRIVTILFVISGSVLFAIRRARRERGSRPVSPSLSYLLFSSCAHCRLTSQRRAASATGTPLLMALTMALLRRNSLRDVPSTPVDDCDDCRCDCVSIHWSTDADLSTMPQDMTSTMPPRHTSTIRSN